MFGAPSMFSSGSPYDAQEPPAPAAPFGGPAGKAAAASLSNRGAGAGPGPGFGTPPDPYGQAPPGVGQTQDYGSLGVGRPGAAPPAGSTPITAFEPQANFAPAAAPATGTPTAYPTSAMDLADDAEAPQKFQRPTLEHAKAVCIGCNYPKAKNPKSRLQGGCLDARKWRNLLCSTYGIDPKQCALLVDCDQKGQPIKPADDLYPSQESILEHLDWLVEDARPGDLLVLVFCGLGAQIPDIDGDEKDGLDEAICPTDYEEEDTARGLSNRLVTDDMFHDYFSPLPKGVNITMIMDCSHGMGMLDGDERMTPSQAEEGPGLPKSQTLEQRWKAVETQNDPMLQTKVRACPTLKGHSFLSKVRKQLLPSVSEMDQNVVGFCFGGSDEGELAAEITLKEPGGVLTACMRSALAELNYDCTYEQLLVEMENKRLQLLDSGPNGSKVVLDQRFVLNHTTMADPESTEFLMPLGKGLLDRAVKPQRQKKANEMCGFLCKQVGAGR